RLEDMVKNKFLNDDMLSVDLFTAINKVTTGELAVTQVVGSVAASHIPTRGDRVGMMVMPVFGDGKLAGIPISDSQGWGIPSAAKHKKESADILQFMQSPERLKAFWDLHHFFPTNTTWDPS